MDTQSNSPGALSSIVLYVVGIALVIVAGGWVTLSNRKHDETLGRESEARAAEVKQGPAVTFATVVMSPDTRGLAYLGEAKPFQSVTLYAKLSGYVNRIDVDRGDRVKAGQLLATIDSPETADRIRQAEAQLENRRSIFKRAQELGKMNFYSQQAVDQARADARVAEAALAEIRQEKNYQAIKAPFDGVVTARYVDRGALVQNAANAQTSALPIVAVAQNERLRIFVYLDQRDVSRVHVGDAADIVDPGVPDRVYKGKVARTTGELDPKTRTLMTEVDVDNPDGALIPGSFLQVTLRVKAPSLPEIPAGALVLRGAKTLVAQIGSDDVVHFVPVVVAEHDGQIVRLKEGVSPGMRVALNAGEAVTEGSKVRATAAPPK
jgi:membrane fusion protein, multidrug efflux system